MSQGSKLGFEGRRLSGLGLRNGEWYREVDLLGLKVFQLWWLMADSGGGYGGE